MSGSGDDDVWPFGDQPSPWTDEGRLVVARQGALGFRRVLRQRGWQRTVLLIVLLGPPALIATVAVIAAILN